RLNPDNSAAVYRGSTGRGGFFEHRAGTRPTVRHNLGHTGDHRRVVTTTKYLVGYAREFSPCGTAGTRGPGDDVSRATEEKRDERATRTRFADGIDRVDDKCHLFFTTF